MTLFRHLLTALTMMTALWAAPSLAQNPFADVALTPERVEAVIAAYDPMRVRAQEIGARFKGKGDAGNVAQQLQMLAMAGGAVGALDNEAQSLGFAGYMDWLTTTYAVFTAHAFAKHPQMNDKMQKALDQIDSQASLTAAQKEQMKAAIRQSMGALESMRPSDENLAAVAPYAEEIKAMIE